MKLKTLCCFLFLLAAATIHAQVTGKSDAKITDVKPPKGPAYDAVVQAYLHNDPEAAAEKFPAYEKIYPAHLYTAFFKAWIADQKDGDRDGALRSYSDIIRKDSTFADAYVWRSKLFWNKGLDDRAISDINKAIKIEGDKAPAQYFTIRADYYFSANNFNAALDDFKHGAQLAPAHPANYIGFMRAAFEAGKSSEMETLITGAINGSQKNNADLHFVYGTFLMQSKRFKESDAIYTNAFKLSGADPDGNDYNNASIVAYKLKDYSKATTLSDKAIAMAPKKIEFLFNRASIAMDQQQWETVYQWAQKALSIDSENAYANMLMAVAIKRTGRGDALSAEYEAKAKQLEKNNR